MSVEEVYVYFAKFDFQLFKNTPTKYFRALYRNKNNDLLITLLEISQQKMPKKIHNVFLYHK